MDPGLESDVVLGAAFPPEAARQVRRVLDTRPGRLHSNLSCLIDLWATADVALISGGTLLYEAGFMGVPAIVVAQNAEQAREASILAEMGACVNLGIGTGNRRAAIRESLQTLAEDSQLRSSMSARALRVFERNGVGAIVARLMARQ
jgi:spore coat polysaccharide biosynthesis predicted glycosyltransferase SpsG